MTLMKNDKSQRLLTAFLALGILVSGWGLLALESQHRSDRAVARSNAVQIAKNQETISNLAASNAANAKTLARAQKEIELEGRQIAILEKQVIDLGGRPLIVVSTSNGEQVAPSPSSTKKKSPQPKQSPSSHPSPSPTCSGVSVGSICLP